MWPLGQAVKTPPFHGGNRGSIPLGVTILRSHSSAGRAPALQAGGHRFDPCCDHHKTFNGSVAQLVRVPACHAGGRGFEPLLSRHMLVWLNWQSSWLVISRLSVQVRSSAPYVVEFPSGQRGQTVNLLSDDFEGSNPSSTTRKRHY